MRKFAQPQGITFTIPSFGAPGTEIKAFQGYLLLIVGDTLAVADLIGFKKSFSRRAYSLCWQCYCKGVRAFVCVWPSRAVLCDLVTHVDRAHICTA